MRGKYSEKTRNCISFYLTFILGSPRYLYCFCVILIYRIFCIKLNPPISAMLKWKKKKKKRKRRKKKFIPFFEDKFISLSLSHLPPYTLFEARPSKLYSFWTQTLKSAFMMRTRFLQSSKKNSIFNAYTVINGCELAMMTPNEAFFRKKITTVYTNMLSKLF